MRTALIVFLLSLLSVFSQAPPYQRQFFTTNTDPVVQVTAGSNVFVTYTTTEPAGQVRTFRVDVPTNWVGTISGGYSNWNLGILEGQTQQVYYVTIGNTNYFRTLVGMDGISLVSNFNNVIITNTAVWWWTNPAGELHWASNAARPIPEPAFGSISNNYNVGIKGLLALYGTNGAVPFTEFRVSGIPDRNTYVGRHAGLSNSTGVANTFIGGQAGGSNISGSYNTYVGARAGRNGITGPHNVAVGFDALRDHYGSSGFNVAIGSQALMANGNFQNNVAIGYNALSAVTNSSSNIAIGTTVMPALYSGYGNNVCIGQGIGNDWQKESYNTVVGVGAMANTLGASGSNNSVFGYHAGVGIKGTSNTCAGVLSLGDLTWGFWNTAFGVYAGRGLDSGSNNLFLGDYIGVVDGTTFQPRSNILIGVGGRLKAHYDGTNDWKFEPSLSTPLYVTATNGVQVGYPVMTPFTNWANTNSFESTRIPATNITFRFLVPSNVVSVVYTNVGWPYSNVFDNAMIKSNPAISQFYITNYGTTGDALINVPFYTASASTSAPAWNEFVTKDYVDTTVSGAGFDTNLLLAANNNWTGSSNVFDGKLYFTGGASTNQQLYNTVRIVPNAIASGSEGSLMFMKSTNGQVAWAPWDYITITNAAGDHIAGTNWVLANGFVVTNDTRELSFSNRVLIASTDNNNQMLFNTNGTMWISNRIANAVPLRIDRFVAGQTTNLFEIYSNNVPLFIVKSNGVVHANGNGVTNITPTAIVSNGTYLVNGVLATNSGVLGAGAFLQEIGVNRAYSFNGSGLTNLSASALASGTVPNARLEDASASDVFGRTVVCWGDSLTGGYVAPQILPTICPTNVYYDGGVAGETSTQVKTRLLAAAAPFRGMRSVIWVGANNPILATVTNDVFEMVSSLSNQNFIIIGVMAQQSWTNGHPTRTIMDNINSSFTNWWSSKVFLVNDYLVSLIDTNLYYSDYTNGIPSDPQVGGAVHLSALGYSQVATQLAVLLHANWIAPSNYPVSTRFSDQLSLVNPYVQATNVVIGNLTKNFANMRPDLSYANGISGIGYQNATLVTNSPIGFTAMGYYNLTVGKNAANGTTLLGNQNAITAVTIGARDLLAGEYNGYNATSIGSANVLLGERGLFSATSIVDHNVTLGGYNLYNVTGAAGSRNFAAPYRAGTNLYAGYDNVFLGTETGVSPTTTNISYSTAIGYKAVVTASNQVVIGTANNTVVIPATNVNVSGTATATNFTLLTPQWIDVPVVYVFSVLGPSTPVLVATRPGGIVKVLAFDHDAVLYGQGQFPHNLATTNANFPNFYFEPHVHFSVTNLPANQSNVVWQCEWEVASINGTYALGTNSVTNAVTAVYTHYMAELGHITNNPPSGISSVFRCRLTRPNMGDGDYGNTSDVLLDGFDVHVPVGNTVAIGSRNDNSQ